MCSGNRMGMGIKSNQLCSWEWEGEATAVGMNRNGNSLMNWYGNRNKFNNREWAWEGLGIDCLGWKGHLYYRVLTHWWYFYHWGQTLFLCTMCQFSCTSVACNHNYVHVYIMRCHLIHEEFLWKSFISPVVWGYAVSNCFTLVTYK